MQFLGLPGTLSPAEFKKHFSAVAPITDAKILPDRRIGFVGYGSHEEAQRAVKYFNKSFIRMSRLRVELAKPITESKTTKNTESKGTNVNVENSSEKVEKQVEDNEKLEEYLEISRSKKRKRNGGENADGVTVGDDGQATVVSAEKDSDEEYENFQKKAKRASPNLEESQRGDMKVDAEVQTSESTRDDQVAVSDADWARSRTSRLLGLLEDDEEDGIERSANRYADSRICN